MIIPSRKLMNSLKNCAPVLLMIGCWSLAVFATNGQQMSEVAVIAQPTNEIQLASTASIPETNQVEDDQPIVQDNNSPILASVKPVMFDPITSIDIASIINEQIENREKEEDVDQDVDDEYSEEETDSEQPTSDGFVYLKSIPLSEDLQRYTYNICIEKDLRYTLILAIMKRESEFKVNAVGYNKDGTTDSGLMQLNDSTRPFLRERGITNYMDPYENIRGGTTLIRYLLDKYDERAAMMAYQYGEGGMASKYRQGIYTSQAIEKLYRFEAEIILLMAEASSNTSSHTGV